MSGLKALKLRIGSVKSTRKITKAMQMVAAAKLRRTQEAAEQSRPYAKALTHILTSLSSTMRDLLEPVKLFSGTGKDDTVLLLVMTADRGLCGGFNANIVKYARERVRRLEEKGKKVVLMTVGRRASDSFRKTHDSVLLKKRHLSEVKNIDFAFAQEITNDLIVAFEAGQFDCCEIVSSEFISVISQIPHHKAIIPVSVPQESEGMDYEIEPSPMALLEDIVPKNLAVQVYAALLENAAGEQGARMSAMDNATRNAGDMINRLTLQYNRTRQANITRELIEIISGAEAL